MATRNVFSNEVSVDEQGVELADEQVDEDGFEVVDEAPELRPSVEQEIQAKVDANHPDGMVDTSEERIYGVTLEQEECIRAREEELAHISAQATFGSQEGRAERTRAVVEETCGRVKEERVHPQEDLTSAEFGEVNQQASRVHQRVRGGESRAVVARRIAERVVSGEDVGSAVLKTIEDEKRISGVIVPIAEVPDVSVGEVTVEGEIIELWEPSTPNIQQVGLIADESEVTKFTVWERSNQPVVAEGEVVRLCNVKKSWHRGRCSLVATGWSRVVFPERGRWWA
jgi:hypothetical protein